MDEANAARHQRTGRDPVGSCPAAGGEAAVGGTPWEPESDGREGSVSEFWLAPEFCRALPVELDDPDVRADLILAHRTKGKAYFEGRLATRAAREIIGVSEEALDDASGAECFLRQRVHGIGRYWNARVPVPLVGPVRLSAPPFTSIIGVAIDLCAWISIPALVRDPLGEFDDRPVPAMDDLDLVEALSFVHVRYATVARARRQDSGFLECLIPARQGFRYAWRPLLRWSASRRHLIDEREL